ncbi:MAG: FlgD immunoglobulin-like domain containing protein [Bacteroidota bacterium]
MHTQRLILFPCLFSVLLVGAVQAQWVQTNGPYGGFVNAIAVSGTNLFAGTANFGVGDGVFLSTNNGTSWTAVNTGLSNTSVLALALSGTNLFAGTSGGVFLSTNNGTSWTAVNTGLTNTTVFALAVSGTNLFAGTLAGGVFLSTNNGTSWTAVNSGLTNTDVRSLAVSGTNLFAGTGGRGVFVSTNNGTSWVAANTGMPTNTRVVSLAVSGTNLFAGTGGSGVWRRPLSEMVSVRLSSDDLPTEFSLEQNYPNPFNPETRIRFALSKTEPTQLDVFDILGRHVRSLVKEQLSAGDHEVVWDGQNDEGRSVASGVYLYRLVAGQSVNTKRMLLLR